MACSLPVRADFERGQLTLGTLHVALLRGPSPGAFRVECAGGPLVRLLSFAERSRLIADALADEDSATALVQALMAAMVLEPGRLDPVVLRAVVLTLAGGGEEVVSLAETAVEAARVRGWNWQELNDAPALMVDRAAVARAPTADDGWHRIVFAAAEEPDLETLCREMVETLLDRGANQSAGPTTRRSVQADAPQSAAPRAKMGSTGPTRVEASQPREAASPTSEKRRRPAFAIRVPGAKRVPPASGVPAPAHALPRRLRWAVLSRERWQDAAQQTNPLPSRPVPTGTTPAPTGEGIGTLARGGTVSRQPVPAEVPRPAARLGGRTTSVSLASVATWPEPPLRTFVPKIDSPAPGATAAILPPLPVPAELDFDDWFDAVARRLEAECDLRGIEP